MEARKWVKPKTDPTYERGISGRFFNKRANGGSLKISRTKATIPASSGFQISPEIWKRLPLITQARCKMTKTTDTYTSRWYLFQFLPSNRLAYLKEVMARANRIRKAGKLAHKYRFSRNSGRRYCRLKPKSTTMKRMMRINE